jgi:syntaxin 1B/2/3
MIKEAVPSSSRVEFLGDSDDLRQRLDAIDKLVDKMMDTVYRFQSVTTVPERKVAVATFEATVLDANTRLRDAKSTLDGLSEANNEFQTKFGEEKATEWSFRVAAIGGHTKRMRGLFTRIATAQSMFEGELNRRVSLQGAFSPEATGELPYMSAESRGTTPVAAKALANASIEDQRMRSDDMRRVEKSLREIREAFLQIAALVDSQGDMLDCIEFSVVNAKNYSHQANVQLIKARKKQRQRSLLILCCSIFLTVALVFLILFILNSTGVLHIFNR